MQKKRHFAVRGNKETFALMKQREYSAMLNNSSMIIIIDNYDSFTYNLVQLISANEKRYIVMSNDKISLDAINRLQPSHILISHGPGRPENAGIIVDVIKYFASSILMFGVCLGHQTIGYAFGGTITRTPILMHGKTSLIYHNNTGIYRALENPFTATRYHSLIIAKENFPAELEITATTEEGIIMGVRHRKFPLEGIQFNPESILTKAGALLISNWLQQ